MVSVRPQDAAEQTACYSGKKKDHTVKNVLLVNAPLMVLFLSETVGGRVHDKRRVIRYKIYAVESRMNLSVA